MGFANRLAVKNMLHVVRTTKTRLAILWRTFPRSHREAAGRRFLANGKPKSLQALRQQRLHPSCLSRQTAAAAPAPSSDIPREQLPPAGSRAKLGMIPIPADVPVRCRLWILKLSISLKWPCYSAVPNPQYGAPYRPRQHGYRLPLNRGTGSAGGLRRSGIS